MIFTNFKTLGIKNREFYFMLSPERADNSSELPRCTTNVIVRAFTVLESSSAVISSRAKRIANLNYRLTRSNTFPVLSKINIKQHHISFASRKYFHRTRTARN